MKEIVLYEEQEIVLDVELKDETIWITQKQLCELFGRDKSVISRHINNIFKSGELEKSSTVAKNATVQIEGKREVVREIEYYNLDLIISVGYRVNSKRATKFRQWATKVLKDHILKGYTINKNRLENSLLELKKEIELIERVAKQGLNEIESKGFLEIITKYTKSFILLNAYDEQKLYLPKGNKPRFLLDYDERYKLWSRF